MCHVLSALQRTCGRTLVRLDLPDSRGSTFTMHLLHATGAPRFDG